MYVDNGTIDLPNLYDGFPTDGTIIKNDDGSFGIPIDNSTIVLNNGKLTVVGGTDESGGLDDVNVTGTGNAVTGASLLNNVLTLTKGESFLTSHQTIYNLTFQAGAFSAKIFDPNGAAQTVNIPTKTSHIMNDSSFVTSSYVDGKFVTIAGSEDVTGVHNFTNGLKVGGIKMSKSQSDVVFLEGNLVVSGAVTMFGTNSVTASTVMDGVVVDGTTIMNDGKKLYLNPDLEIGGGLDETALASYLTTNKYLTQTTGDTRYVTALSTNGNYLTYTKNGQTNNITVPYATKATQDGNGNTIAATYLKLSGGTVTGNVVMNGGSATSSLIIRRSPSVMTFQNSSGTTLGYLGFSAKDTPCMYTSGNVVKTLLHSGNYNDYAPKLDGTGASGTWGISISGNASTATNALNLYNNSTGDKLGLGTSQPYFFDASASSGAGATYNLLHRGLISTGTFGNNYLDVMVQYTINTTSLSTSNYYPIIFASTPKMMRVSMHSQTGSASATYNCNSLDFSFRGQGWADVPQSLTVHHYGTYAESEKTIGCIGMGQEGGMKVVWVRGGLTYYISSNVTPILCSSNYTNGNEIYTVGTNQYGGTNTKVTILWTPQSTSDRGSMYHRNGLVLGGGLYTAGNLSIIGTSTFTGLATFNGNLTAPASTVNNSLSGSYQFRNIYGEHLSSAGWYRFATSSTANNAGGTYIFFIRRSYYNSNNESYIISCTVDFGKVHWCILNGHANTRLITQVRCTFTNNSTMYFDLYYSGTVQNDVYVNAIGNCTLQKPTATTSTLTTTSTLSLTDGIKLGTTSAYPITVFRNATNGGAYIMYGANGQLTKSWAAGSDASHNFAWYYKDTSAGTDVRKMYLDSSGNLVLEGNLLVKGGITMYATSSTSPITEFYASYLKVTGNMDVEGNINSTYYMLNNKVTNPYLKLTHTYDGTTYTNYLQGYQSYLYLGAGSTKSLRISSDGSLYTPKTLTQGSDIRYKDIHKDILLSLATMAEAPSIEFHFKDDEQKSTHIGTSA